MRLTVASTTEVWRPYWTMIDTTNGRCACLTGTLRKRVSTR